jgi:hypothetical protein
MVEFSNKPHDMEGFTKFLDHTLQTKNAYYKDLIQGHVLRPLVISTVNHEAFIAYMKSEGKLGGQNKLPRLANDRKIADKLSQG